MAYKGTVKPVADIAHELHVDFVLEGSLRGWGKKVRISGQLIQVRDQTQLWAQSYERESGDVLALQSEIAQAIAHEIDVKLASPRAGGLAPPGPVNPDAYEAYLKGRFYWWQRTEEGIRKGIEYFNQAIEHDPGYAVAYVGLADSYSLLALRGIVPAREAFPKAKLAVQRALTLDPGLGEAYCTLAHIRLHERDWQGVEDDFRRGLQASPGEAIAYSWYAEYLTAMARSDESIAVVQRALQIDPLSAVIATTLPHTYYFARRYDPAIRYLHAALQLYPEHFMLHLRLGQVYLQRGMRSEAIREMQQAVDLSGKSTETLAGLAQAYASSGMASAAQQILGALTANAPRQYVSPYNIARAWAAGGDREQTFGWLEKALAEGDPDLIELRGEPAFDSVRSDPRFRPLLVRVGWPNP